MSVVNLLCKSMLARSCSILKVLKLVYKGRGLPRPLDCGESTCGLSLSVSLPRSRRMQSSWSPRKASPPERRRMRLAEVALVAGAEIPAAPPCEANRPALPGNKSLKEADPVMSLWQQVQGMAWWTSRNVMGWNCGIQEGFSLFFLLVLPGTWQA